MNNMTVTEANHNFSELCRKTDAEGVIHLTKNGKFKYAVMTERRYKAMIAEKYFGRRGNEVIRIVKTDGKVEITQVLQMGSSGEFVNYRIATLPANVTEMRLKGNSLSIYADFDKERARLKDLGQRIVGSPVSFGSGYIDDLDGAAVSEDEFERLSLEELRKAAEVIEEIGEFDRIYEIVSLEVTLLGENSMSVFDKY